MTVFLIIVSLYGGIERIPMPDEAACKTAQNVIKGGWDGTAARAYCIKGSALTSTHRAETAEDANDHR